VLVVRTRLARWRLVARTRVTLISLVLSSDPSHFTSHALAVHTPPLALISRVPSLAFARVAFRRSGPQTRARPLISRGPRSLSLARSCLFGPLVSHALAARCAQISDPRFASPLARFTRFRRTRLLRTPRSLREPRPRGEFLFGPLAVLARYRGGGALGRDSFRRALGPKSSPSSAQTLGPISLVRRSGRWLVARTLARSSSLRLDPLI
jgi:hypothetical protein